MPHLSAILLERDVLNEKTATSKVQVGSYIVNVKSTFGENLKYSDLLFKIVERKISLGQ